MGYAKLSIHAIYGTNSDYSSGTVASTFSSDTFTTAGMDKYRHTAVVNTSTPLAIQLGAYSSIDYVIIQNLDDTNFVTLAYTNASGPTAHSQKILNGKFIVLPDVQASSDMTLTADTANCLCEVIIIGTLA